MTAEIGCESGLRVRSDRASLIDAVISANLLFIAFQYFLRVQHLECVLKQVDFAFIIGRSIRSHRRRGIDLDQPWAQLVIKQDIEAVEFKAMLVVDNCLRHGLK